MSVVTASFWYMKIVKKLPSMNLDASDVILMSQFLTI